MSDVGTFVLGCVGALAPEIVRLYTLRSKPDQFAWSPFYLIASGGLALLGGVVAIVLPATTPWAAFYAGVSAPVIVNQAVQRGSSALKGRAKPLPNATKGLANPAVPGLVRGSFWDGL